MKKSTLPYSSLFSQLVDFVSLSCATALTAGISFGQVSVDGTATTVTPGTVLSVNSAAVPGLKAANSGEITANGITINLGTGAAASRPNNIGAVAESGSLITLDGSTIASTVTAAGQQGVISTGEGSLISGTGATITVGIGTTLASNLLGAVAKDGGDLSFVNSSISTKGGAKGIANHALWVSGTGSEATFSGGSLNTLAYGSFGAWADAGAKIILSNGTQITTIGAPNTGTDPDTGSYALLATGAGTEVIATDAVLKTSGILATGVRIESGATVAMSGAGSSITTAGKWAHGVWAQGMGSTATISDTAIQVSGIDASAARVEAGAEMSLTSTAITSSSVGVLATDPPSAVRVLSGGTLTMGGEGSSITTTGKWGHGVSAQGTGSTATISDTTIKVSGLEASAARVSENAEMILTNTAIVSNSAGAGDTIPPSAVRVLSGGTLTMGGEESSITATGRRGHGVSVEDIGSTVNISDTAIRVEGDRANGVKAFNGGSASIADSSILTTYAGSHVVNAEDGSEIDLTGTTVEAQGATAYGVRSVKGSNISIADSSVTTAGVDAPGLYSSGPAAGQESTIDATNVTIVTTGNDNAAGVVADGFCTVTVTGGTITTSGDRIRVGAGGAHGMFARNPGGKLISTGTIINTSGDEARGVVADDGGQITLKDNKITTTGYWASGLYSIVEQAGPQFVASITGTNVTVETFGDKSHGAFSHQGFHEAQALVDITDSTITTHGAQSMGLEAAALGTLNTHNVTSLADGAGSHGAVAYDGGTLNINDSQVQATGTGAYGLLAVNRPAVNTGGTPSVANFTGSTLSNVDAPAVGVLGTAEITFTESTVTSENGQWLQVGGITDPLADRVVGGVVTSTVVDGFGDITLSDSTATGSAHTAVGSISDVTMGNNSLWNMSDSSNVTNLDISTGNTVSFLDPSTHEGAYKTLTLNGDLTGNGGLFEMNINLGINQGDLISIEGLGLGTHQLLFENFLTDLAIEESLYGPGHALRVVQTTDGIDGATFTVANQGGYVEAGGFKYYLQLGDGGADTFDPLAWYLVPTIPEPSSALLCCLSTLFFATRRKRK